MKIHLVTIGEPKLAYAREGWHEYIKRLGRYHSIRITHLADKYADDAAAILRTAGNAHKVALVIDNGREYSSPELAHELERLAQHGREVCYLVGGPEGLPAEVIAACEARWSFSRLTFPHDLAMVILAEALYRASTIAAGHPYHRA